MKQLLDAGLLHAAERSKAKRSRNCWRMFLPPPADQDVIRPISNPLYQKGHLAILKGNLASEGSVAKISGVKTPVLTGPARVFESEETCSRDSRSPDQAR